MQVSLKILVRYMQSIPYVAMQITFAIVLVCIERSDIGVWSVASLELFTFIAGTNFQGWHLCKRSPHRKQLIHIRICVTKNPVLKFLLKNSILVTRQSRCTKISGLICGTLIFCPALTKTIHGPCNLGVN